MSNPHKILFLNTELAQYTVASLKAFTSHHNTEVRMVRWPVNPEAPFIFYNSPGISYYGRKQFSWNSLINFALDYQPAIVICSGWVDKLYLAVCRRLKKNGIPVILLLDNPWNGALKQRIASMLSPFFIRNTFTHIWIPGAPQLKYAEALGFKNNSILLNYYSGDFDYFHSFFIKNREEKKLQFPKVFIYVARYVKWKGIVDLCHAFSGLQNTGSNNWELWCLGTGALDGKVPLHDKIKHLGFVQPELLEGYISKTGVYILPSHFEPWGVSLHEFSAAGFPLISSDAVGAATKFIREGENGFIFRAGDVESLQTAMKKMMDKNDVELFKMSEKSAELAKSITPKIWADTLMELLIKK